MRILIALAGAALLAACATPSTYGPAASANQPGYRDTMIERDRVRVTYRGSSGDSSQRVNDLALYRAAEITREAGYEWFEVVQRFQAASAGGGLGFSIGGFGGSGGSGLGAGVSSSPDLSRNEVSLEIVMGNGPAKRSANVYYAEGVLRNISPRVGM